MAAAGSSSSSQSLEESLCAESVNNLSESEEEEEQFATAGGSPSTRSPVRLYLSIIFSMCIQVYTCMRYLQDEYDDYLGGLFGVFICKVRIHLPRLDGISFQYSKQADIHLDTKQRHTSPVTSTYYVGDYYLRF
jgi:hypothetical protein